MGHGAFKGEGRHQKAWRRERDSSFNPTVLQKPWCMYLKGDVPQLMDADEVDAHASGLLTLYTSKYDEPNTNHSLRCLVLRVIKTF